MSYQIVIHPKALKEIKKLPLKEIRKIEAKIDGLATLPRPAGFKKLTNFSTDRTSEKDLYRVRAGDYRIIYTIEENIIKITIIKVKHRKEVYKS